MRPAIQAINHRLPRARRSKPSVISRAATQLSAPVDEIARQVTTSTGVTDRAVEEASRTNDTFQGLSEAVRKKGEVVNLITDIAEQTNLLALNATI